ncbi:quinon protein alcohol dehydrogenase-like superfamily [Trametes maxima]|nr:quinon protein alcohol dehydrogenase-like superfamily [Trametes maxima]
MSHQGPWLGHLDALADQLDAHQAAQAETEERGDKEFGRILRDTCDVVRDAEKDASSELPEVIEKAHAVLSAALRWAYGDEYYFYVPCFSNSKDCPEIEDGMRMCGTDITEIFMEFYTQYLYPGAPRPKLPDFARTTPWTKSPRPHPLSTRLSRFREGVPSPASDTTPAAQLIYQARAQLSIDHVSNPYAMSLSSGGSILAMAGAGGWKERDPVLRYYLLDEQDDEDLESVDMEPGLSNVARYVTTDEERKLIFLADDDRVKSFSWAQNAKGKVPKRLRNIHTMDSQREFCGPLVVIPNGRIARMGQGKAAVWTLDALETHQDNPKKLIGGGEVNRDNSWREDDCTRIELSRGSPPTAVVAFADSMFEPLALHLHTPSGYLLCGEQGNARDTHRYSCVAIDLEHGGKRVARYLGHGQDVDRITASPGDPNVFVTAGSDGYARIFDVRRPLPVLTFNTGHQSEACADVVFVHPDGIPTLFTGGERTEQVKVWDVRGKSVVYELSTGNNAVAGMAWDARRSSLYVSTECRRVNRMGERNGYRQARIPRWATWWAVERAAKELKDGKGEGPEGVETKSPAVGAPDDTPDGGQEQSSTETGPGPTLGEDSRRTQQADEEPSFKPASVEATGQSRQDEEMTDAEEEDEDEGDDDDDDMDYGDDFSDSDAGMHEDARSDEEEEPEDIDEEYSEEKRWPERPYHKEDFFGYAYDGGEHVLMRWHFTPEPDLTQLPPTTDGDIF